jgi:hypothetical protein
MLLPVHEKMEDGVEIVWEDHGRMTMKRIKRLVKTKQQLPVSSIMTRPETDAGHRFRNLRHLIHALALRRSSAARNFA